MGGSLPRWIRFFDEHKSDRFEILTFHDASVQSLDEMDRKLDRGIREMSWDGRDLPFPILHDRTGTTIRQFGVRAFPTTLLIDPDGRLVGTIDSRRPFRAWTDLAALDRPAADRAFLAALFASLDESTAAGAGGAEPKTEEAPDAQEARVTQDAQATQEAQATNKSWREAVVPWEAARDAISRQPRYGGLDLPPQPGLVPLGADPASGLWEFGCRGSGRIPRRRADDGRLELSGTTAIVLVLIPGGSFRMGAQSSDPGAPGYDPAAEPCEAPPHPVSIEPFFLSKYEMTQAQWEAVTGENPSRYAAGRKGGGRTVSRRNPVEQVAWGEAEQTLGRLELALPTEAQWEYAARAGTTTAWWTGDSLDGLDRAGNVADAYLKAHGGETKWTYDEQLLDGQALHAPVGLYRPNPFGLHDTIGNVWEWCRDPFVAYDSVAASPGDGARAGSSSEGRVGRGGSFQSPADAARSSRRFHREPDYRKGNLGVRPARTIRR